MRNKFSGTCYRCGKPVAIGAGHFERHNGGWRTQHADCAIRFRSAKIQDIRQPDPTFKQREAINE